MDINNELVPYSQSYMSIGLENSNKCCYLVYYLPTSVTAINLRLSNIPVWTMTVFNMKCRRRSGRSIYTISITSESPAFKISLTVGKVQQLYQQNELKVSIDMHWWHKAYSCSQLYFLYYIYIYLIFKSTDLVFVCFVTKRTITFFPLHFERWPLEHDSNVHGMGQFTRELLFCYYSVTENRF